jgi:DUF4097 and DUF4098 domain-containing protein YvlB
MSKTTKLVLIFSSILIVCLVGIGIIVGIYYNNGNYEDGLKNMFGKGIDVNETEIFDLDGVSNLNVDCVSGRIEVIESDEAKVTLDGSIWTTQSNDDFLKVTNNSGTIIAAFDTKTKPYGIFNSNVKMTVYLPKDSMLNLEITSSSGEVTVVGLDLSNVSINSTSGKTTVLDCTGENLSLDKSSGSTILTNADFKNIDINSTSGNIDVIDTAADITLISTSGDTTLEKVSGSVDIMSTSGRVNVSIDGMPKEITINSISGGVKLYLDSDAAFDLSTRATSGSIKTDFDITAKDFNKYIQGTVNGGGNQVEVTTTSGNINIIKK